MVAQGDLCQDIKKECEKNHFDNLYIMTAEDMAEAERIANIRQGAHKGKYSRERFNKGNLDNKYGAMAEVAFGKIFVLPVDDKPYRDGDGGVDFHLPVHGHEITCDVKAATNPKHLLVKKGKAHKLANVVVLARVSGGEVEFLGWEHSSIMRMMPVHDFGRGILSHWREAGDLRPFYQLRKLCGIYYNGHDAPKKVNQY